MFFAEEQLQNYFCIGCKRDSQNASLSVSIAQYPEVLAVHLKRFQHGMQSQSSKHHPLGMSKLRHYISYPRRLTFGEAAVYELRGLVVHWGSLEHGHYISVISKTVPVEDS